MMKQWRNAYLYENKGQINGTSKRRNKTIQPNKLGHIMVVEQQDDV